MSDTRDTKLTIKVNDVEKKQVEALAEIYDCSQAAAGRMLFTSHYSDVFGEIHPEALERHDVDVGAIIRGEIDPDELDDDLKMDSNGPAKVPAADGGLSTSLSPSSHSPTYTPQDLATSGTALSWEELKSAVDRHWSDELKIHPDRVAPETLKNNQKVTGKILAGIVRSESDVASDPLLEQKIEEYLGHQIRRADYESGLRYKIDQYKPVIRQHFASHPDEDHGSQYTTPSTKDEEVPRLFELTVRELKENIHKVDFDAWWKTNSVGEDATIGDIEKWTEDLADYRSTLETLSAIVSRDEFSSALRDSDLEYPDEYNDVIHYASSVLNKRLRSYASADPFARYVAAKNVLELDDDELRDEDLDSKAVVKFETGDGMGANGQLAHVAKNVL
ncbi:hypothetical protein [Halomontanus rarus]|uniref:hypothetical protein n=1 Tax=Halomontanus rarus TaxID=3034020 RepID=UPI00307B35B7